MRKNAPRTVGASCRIRVLTYLSALLMVAVAPLSGCSKENEVKVEASVEATASQPVAAKEARSSQAVGKSEPPVKAAGSEEARPCLFVETQSSSCMDFALNATACGPASAPIHCRGEWATTLVEHDGTDILSGEINNWVSDGKWGALVGKPMLIELKWISRDKDAGAKPNQYSAYRYLTEVHVDVPKALAPKLENGLWGLVRLDRYEEGFISDDLYVTLLQAYAPEDYAKEHMAVELEAALRGKRLENETHHRFASLPREVDGGVVLAVPHEGDASGSAAARLFRVSQKAESMLGKAYVRSRFEHHGKDWSSISTKGNEFLTKQGELRSRMTPLQRLHWYAEPVEHFEKRVERDAWALYRPGLKDCDGKRLDMPKTRDEFERQEVLGKLDDLRAERSRPYRESPQYVSFMNTWGFSKSPRPTDLKEYPLSLSGDITVYGEEEYDFKKKRYVLKLETTGGGPLGRSKPTVRYRDLCYEAYASMKIPVPMEPSEAKAYRHELPARVFMVQEFKKLHYHDPCGSAPGAYDYYEAKLIGYEVYFGDKLVTSKCDGCDALLDKLAKD